VEHVGVNINRLALDLVCPTAVISYAADDGINVTTGHADGLAVVERLYSCEKLLVLVEEVCELEQVDAALLWGGCAPCGLEGLPGSGDGDVDILLSGFRDGADNLLRGGINDLEGLLVDRLDPFIVDEAALMLVEAASL
jgi:hypothetical protein